MRTDHEKLLKAGDILIKTIGNAQAKFSQAVYTLNCKPVRNLAKEQREECLNQRNQAAFDIIAYKELLRMCYKVISVPESVDE